MARDYPAKEVKPLGRPAAASAIDSSTRHRDRRSTRLAQPSEALRSSRSPPNIGSVAWRSGEALLADDDRDDGPDPDERERILDTEAA
jgi:hypothetical protein